MLMLPSARVLEEKRRKRGRLGVSDCDSEKREGVAHLNIFPAIPFMFFMCFPTRERMAMSRVTVTWARGEEVSAKKASDPARALKDHGEGRKGCGSVPLQRRSSPSECDRGHGP